MRKLFLLPLLYSFVLISEYSCTSANCSELIVDTTMVIDSVKLADPDSNGLYFNAFPSLTVTASGKYIVGYQKGNGDANCCGIPVIRWTMDPRTGWSDFTAIETDSINNYRNCQVSAYGDTVYMTYFSENLTDPSNYGQVFFRISLDNGVTWSERTRITRSSAGKAPDPYHDTLANEGKLVKFKNKLIVPVYALYQGDVGPAGFAISNTLDRWQTDTTVWTVNPGGMTECNMIAIGDSLIAFFRGNNNDSFYRASSFDGITWTNGVNVTPFNYFGCKPAVYKMEDGSGRIIMNYRGNMDPNPGLVGISCTNGFGFNYVYPQNPNYEFYYGDLARGKNNDEVVNVYSLWTGALAIPAENNVATLYCAIYKIPPSQ